MNEVFTPAMILATIFGTFGATLFVLSVIFLWRDTGTPMDSRWRAFGTGDYNAAQKCSNERGVPVEDTPHDEDTKEVNNAV